MTTNERLEKFLENNLHYCKEDDIWLARKFNTSAKTILMIKLNILRKQKQNKTK